MFGNEIKLTPPPPQKKKKNSAPSYVFVWLYKQSIRTAIQVLSEFVYFWNKCINKIAAVT